MTLGVVRFRGVKGSCDVTARAEFWQLILSYIKLYPLFLAYAKKRLVFPHNYAKCQPDPFAFPNRLKQPHLYLVPEEII